ncbi:FG-GAP-like repeat-containing protein [Micromonospora sp. NPDC051141]|uniref:FG-GAP-like repeat-containing protein n=1 Tax=Micromonospora sp. NPDC051141 TaxID=3364284 RepID=UPI0037A33781
MAFGLSAAQVMAVVQVVSLGLGAVPARAAGPLPFPQVDPSKVANPSATVSAGATRLGGSSGEGSVGDTGGSTYEIPLRVVPGRGGFAPELSLRYSSQTGNGQVGMGFGLTGLSEISRCARSVGDDGVAQGVQLGDNDLLCLNGQKLIAVKGVYGANLAEYRTLPDTHVRVVSYRSSAAPSTEVGPTQFQVWRPDGRIEWYGNSAKAQVSSGSSTVNTSWLIELATDRSGNRIEYSYGRRTSTGTASEVERWIDSIRYGRSGSMDRLVEFGYETRPDARYGFALGAPRESTKRLASVTMSLVSGGVKKRARSYTLSYDNTGASKASKLSSVLECGVSTGECKRPTRLRWTLGSQGFDNGTAQTAWGLVPTSDASQIVTADFNGDGRTDLAWPESATWKRALAHGAGSPAVYTTTVNGGPASQGVASRALPLDYDGDGRTDLVPRDGAATWRVHASRPDGSVADVSTPFTGGLNSNSSSSGAFTGDFNGDGYQDVLQYARQGTTNLWDWSWRANTGAVSASFDAATNPSDDKAFTAPKAGGPPQSDPPASIMIADVFGDGRDRVLFAQDGMLWARDLLVSGSGAATKLPAKVLQLDKQWLDVNGDGLVDLVTNGGANGVKGSSLYYWLNTGRGFTGATATGATAGSHAFGNGLVVDYDGDGRQDLLVARPAGGAQLEPLYVGLDVIRATVSPAGAVSLTRNVTTINFNAMAPDIFDRQGARTVDANGDGLTDVLLVERPPAGTTGAPVLKLYRHNTDGGPGGDRLDLLWKVYEGSHNPKGTEGDLPPTVEFRYAPLSDSAVYSPGGCPRITGLSCSRGGGSYVVKQVRRDAGVDTQKHLVSNYFYVGGRLDRFGRGMLGFAERLLTTFPSDNPSRAVTQRSFYTNTQRNKDPRLQQQWTVHSLPGGRQRLDRLVNSWAVQGAGLLFFNYVSEAKQPSYEFTTISNLNQLTPAQFDGLGKPAFRTVTRTVSDMDVYGNAGKTVTLSNSATSARSGRTTVTLTPDVDESVWLVQRPKKVTTLDEVFDPVTQQWGPAQTRTRLYTYETSTDRVKTDKSYASDTKPGRELLTSYEYDVSGNVLRTTLTDMATDETREATFAFDDLGYPHAAMNGKQQTSYTGYDPVLGVVKVAVDVNGLRTDYTYDTLGRPVKEKSPTGAEQSVSYGLEEVGPENLVRVQSSDGTGAMTQAVLDRLGRPVISRFKGSDNVMRRQVATFDAQGMLTSQSVPGYSSTPVADLDKVTFTYDDLGRITSQREPGTAKARTWDYSGLVTTYTDTRGGQTSTTADHRGQVVSQSQKDASQPQSPTRTYTYGPFGTLLSTRNGSDATTVSYSFDDQGAMTSSTEAERGKTVYTYNAFGQLTTSTDANGRYLVLNYDPLGREYLRKTTDAAGALLSSTTRTWDNLNGRTTKGRLMQVSNNDRTIATAAVTVSTDYFYDTFSRLDRVTQTQPQNAEPAAPNETLTADYDYDTFNRPTAVTYPKLPGQTSPVKVDYVYGPAATSNGSLTRVQTGTETLWTAKDHDAQGRLVVEEAGDGVTTSRTLDWAGRVEDLTTSTSDTDINPGTTLFAESYSYDDEGNLKTRAQGAVTEEFTYDDLNRLATAKTYSPTSGVVYQTDNWHYDRLGNLTTSELRGSYTYADPAKPNQVTQVTGGLFGTRTYSYDKVGNQTGRPGATVGYNTSDLPNLITPTSGAATRFLYDGNSARIRKTTGADTVTYLPGLYERHQTGLDTEHRLLVRAGGATATLVYRQAAGASTVTKQPTLFTHTDRLGSVRLVTKNKNVTGGLQAVPVEKRSYDAFGKRRNPDLTRGDDQYQTGIQNRTLDQGYTSHDEDDESGLVNMKARLYDPTLGRFTTPDTIISGANPVQAWNRFAYVSNNPLRYTDPTGHEECDSCPPPDPVCADQATCGGTMIEVCATWPKCGDPGPDGPGPGKHHYTGGAPGGHVEPGDEPDETSGESCRPPLRCDDLPDDNGDSADGHSGPQVCEVLCSAGTADPASTERQTSPEMSTSNNNPAATDVPIANKTYPGKDIERFVDSVFRPLGITTPAGQALALDIIGTVVGVAATVMAGQPSSPASLKGTGPISMNKAVELGAAHVGGQGKAVTSGSGGVQFINSSVDAAGRTVTKISRFDINPNSGHVQALGAHLNLETQINGKTVTSGPMADPHIPIDPATIRPGDY